MTTLILQYLPFLVVALALKGLRIRLLAEGASPLAYADALGAELGLHLLWLGALGWGLARIGSRRRPQWLLQALLSGGAFLWIALEGVAVTFAAETGGALDHHLFRFALVNLVAVIPVLGSEVPVSRWASLGMLAALLVAGRTWQIARRPPAPPSARAALACVLLGALGLALLPVRLPRAIATPLPLELAIGPWRHPLRFASADGLAAAPYRRDGRLEPRDPPPRFDHVVVVALESTGWFATSLAADGPATTPFLSELADESAVFERAYVAVPHSSKAVVALNCGITPLLVMDVREAGPGGMPVRCLPDLLREQGFQTLYFGAHVGGFEHWRRLMRNLGFAVTTTVEGLDREGFEVVNYFSLEDDVLLAPTREWLERTADRPVYSFYLTSTAHHDYRIPERMREREFSRDDRHDRYLNAVRYQDRFVAKLFALYREAGLADRTIFVVVGDHGEAFGEHGRWLHDHVPYDEVIRVPLLIHGAGIPAGRHDAVVSHPDLAPTLARLLGFDLVGGGYDGRPLFERGPDALARVSCFYTERCLALVTPHRKLVSHFDHAPPEAYAIDRDPRETRDVFGEDPGDPAALAALHAWKREQLGRFLVAPEREGAR